MTEANDRLKRDTMVELPWFIYIGTDQSLQMSFAIELEEEDEGDLACCICVWIVLLLQNVASVVLKLYKSCS